VVRVTIVRERGAVRSQEPRERTLRIRYFQHLPSGEVVIEAEVAELLASPCSLLVGTVDRHGLPDATRAWGVELLGPDRLRVFVATEAQRTIDNVADGGRIALTTTNFMTVVSWQLKGRATLVEAATPADRIRSDVYCAACLEILAPLHGDPEELIARMLPSEIVAVEMVVEQVFDQTPGPGAGVRVAPEVV
jgi:Pyridoxamine 5'-phosphate oxidase